MLHPRQVNCRYVGCGDSAEDHSSQHAEVGINQLKKGCTVKENDCLSKYKKRERNKSNSFCGHKVLSIISTLYIYVAGHHNFVTSVALMFRNSPNISIIKRSIHKKKI